MEATDFHIDDITRLLRNKESFPKAELVSLFQSFDPHVSESTINWRILSLVNSGVIQRVGRGLYKCGTGVIYVPQLTPNMQKANNQVRNNFPYIKHCIWNINEINFFSQHLINKDICYVEVDRDAVEAVFEHLREKFNFVLKGKSDDNLYFGKSTIIVRPLVTSSPVQTVKNIPTTTIEKLLVDLFADKEFDFLHGNEMTHIFKNAFSKYTINMDKLLRYASRREKRASIAEFVATIR